jgi:hypothetical protein
VYICHNDDVDEDERKKALLKKRIVSLPRLRMQFYSL